MWKNEENQKINNLLLNPTEIKSCKTKTITNAELMGHLTRTAGMLNGEPQKEEEWQYKTVDQKFSNKIKNLKLIVKYGGILNNHLNWYFYWKCISCQNSLLNINKSIMNLTEILKVNHFYLMVMKHALFFIPHLFLIFIYFRFNLWSIPPPSGHSEL